MVKHVIGMSGGKDSTAVACLAIERAERKGYTPRFIFADTGNEDQITLDHLAYLGAALNITIETVQADFTDRFLARREQIPAEWAKEKRRKKHSYRCRKDGCQRDCSCPVVISPPVSSERIAEAVEAMRPSGNPYLDLCMLKGRFPSRRAQFCTEELKVAPIRALLDPILASGSPIIQWLGERAEESPARAKKPPLLRIRNVDAAAQVLYRPILRWKAEECFAIAARHGLKPNPLYRMGFSRVGCLPCVNCAKSEIRQADERLPHNIDRIRRWEAIVALCARRGDATFFPAPMVPGVGHTRAAIDRSVAWSKTTRGGRQFDLMQELARREAEADGAMCESAYGLCE